MTFSKPAGESQELPGGGAALPRLAWDIGTGYDLFVSLAALHSPERFGLRASWAAGVRSRLPSAPRKILEEVQPFLWAPLHWLHSLPEPKDAATVLWGLRQIPVEERLYTLALSHRTPDGVPERLYQVSSRRSWDESDLEALKNAYRGRDHELTSKQLTHMLYWWSHPQEFGEQYLAALTAYQQVFFAEEEKHISAALVEGLEYARDLAKKLSLLELIEELSQGVHFNSEDFQVQEVVLAPTYWSTPLVIYSRAVEGRLVLLFGVRPADASLVPGEQVPDALLQTLKALADPTRLRILRYLANESVTPSELARRLRLRAPTVTHHLNALRLAGLVRLTLQPGGERRYAARVEAIAAMSTKIQEFLETGEDGEG